MTNPLGAVTRWEYDDRGLPVTEVSPTGGVVRTTFDALGRPTAVTDATGATTRTAYTPRGDVASIASPDGVSVAFRYDADQQPIVMTDALGATGWTWDAASNLTSQTDASGARISYRVDAVGQVVATTTPLGTVTNTFDAAGNQTAVASPWGSASFGFDANGRMTGVTRSNGITTSNTFDAAGQVTSIVHQTPVLPDPVASIASSVDAWDREHALPGDAGACMAAAEVQALDTDAATETPAVVTDYLDSRRDPGTDLSGCVKTGVYADRRGLPDRELPMAAGGQIAYGYTYTLAGSLATQTATVGDTSTWTGFDYDALKRLTSSVSTDGTVNAYGWDAAGNRTVWNTTKAPDTGEPLSVAAAYDAAGALVAENRARVDGTTELRYSLDADGRRTSMTVTDPDGDSASTAYAYTGAGLLASVSTDIETVTYGYDGLGRAVQTVTDFGGPQIATWTWWDGDTAAGITSTQGVDAGIVTDPVGQVLLQSGAPGAASSSAAWLLQDVRSSTTATATGQGRVTDVTGYSDFGVPTLPTEGWAAVASFTGKSTATTEGLGRFPARTYDPLAGSWLTADSHRGSIADPATLNRYAYVTGDPATLIDPTGNVGSRAILGDAPRGKALPSFPAKAKALGTTSRPKNPGVGGVAASDSSDTSAVHPPVRALSRPDACSLGDWECRIAAEAPSCKGSGRFRTCWDGRAGPFSCSYTYNWPITTIDVASAREVMELFKANPSRIFPFKVDGCSRFVTGAECTLLTATGTTPGYTPTPQNSTGLVGVDTTWQSVTFTVIAPGYFDGPGSTIEFSTWTDKDGTVYLQQVADAHGTPLSVWAGVQFGIGGGAYAAWELQAQNLRDELSG